MRHARIAALLGSALLAPVVLLGGSAAGVAAAAGHPSSRRASPSDPGPAVRPSRALTATIAPTTDGSTAGLTVRLTANPVTGQLCTTGTGLGAAPAAPGSTGGAAADALELAGPAGVRMTLTGASFAGCVSGGAALAVALLAQPGGYSVVLVSPAGDVADAPLAATTALARPWPVGTRTEVVVDRTRGTARRGSVPASRTRTLRVTYFYPARTGAVDTRDRDGAPASPEGPFPVVLFSPGYAVTPATYELTLHAWAAAGYVVAAVLSPGSGGGLPGAPTEADLTEQPGDLSAVLSVIDQHTVDPSSWLGGVADAARVAVAGHSDGGSTAAAAGLLQRYSDPRFDAVLVLAGASFGGTPAHRKLPLLLVTGQDDQYNRPATFARVYALGGATRTWVQALGATHLTPFVVNSAQAGDLRSLEVAFLDRSLLGAQTAPVERALAAERGLTRIVAGRF